MKNFKKHIYKHNLFFCILFFGITLFCFEDLTVVQQSRVALFGWIIAGINAFSALLNFLTIRNMEDSE